jgi:hypothetical protein
MAFYKVALRLSCTTTVAVSVVISVVGFFIRPAIGAIEPFRHERRAVRATDAWGGMRTDWTAVADCYEWSLK